MGDISKIPNNGIVFTSDNNKIGNLEILGTKFIFVFERSMNSKLKIYRFPREAIAVIEENKLNLNITRREMDKYIRKGDDPGKPRGRYGITIEEPVETGDSFEVDLTTEDESEKTSADDTGRTREFA